ncbi:MAG: UpxY family transcription antiterminator [Salegentibacter sp.]
MSWYVLYTKPRTELKVAARLQEMKLEVFCPSITELRQWSDRKKKVTSPLFKSYVFVNLKEQERNLVFDVPGVVRYLFWLGKPATVRDKEIETIRKWIEDDEVEDLQIDHLTPGDKLTINSGTFKEQQAIIKEIGNKRMKLLLPSLGCTVNARIKDII